MNVTLYSMIKKKNSTKQPDNSTIRISYNDVILKDQCSTTNPIIVIRFEPGTVNFALYNYCYITEFRRYYYITDCIFVRNGIVEIHCTCDVLATYKDVIGSHSCYILRAATGYNQNLPDSKFPVTGEVIVKYRHPVDINTGADAYTNHSPWVINYVQGIYVIGVISKESSPGGSLSYYAMNSDQFEHFKSIFLGDTSWAVGSFAGFEISEELWKSLFNPFQYIASCRWFPIPSINGTYTTTIKLGWWDIPNCPCVKLTRLYIDIDPCKFPLPSHDVVTYPFLNLPPYAQYKLYIPPFGIYDLDGFIVGKLYSGIVYGEIKAYIRIDLVSGEGALLVSYLADQQTSTSQQTCLVWDTARIAVDISFGQINSDIVGAIRSGVGIIESASRGISNLDPSAIIGGVAGGLIDAVQSFVPTSQYKPGDGTIAQYQSVDFRLEARFQKLTEYATDDFGGLVYKTERIDSHEGYILTYNAHIEILGALHEEIAEIETLMDGGFFYE